MNGCHRSGPIEEALIWMILSEVLESGVGSGLGLKGGDCGGFSSAQSGAGLGGLHFAVAGGLGVAGRDTGGGLRGAVACHG